MNESASLPAEITEGASLRGNEYGWALAAFPDALGNAEALGYACIGGQFQFRLEKGTCEMYWIESNAGDRSEDETWTEYCHRSCTEVLTGFQRCVEETDFRAQALHWEFLKPMLAEGFDPIPTLVFVAYFENETEANAVP